MITINLKYRDDNLYKFTNLILFINFEKIRWKKRVFVRLHKNNKK